MCYLNDLFFEICISPMYDVYICNDNNDERIRAMKNYCNQRIVTPHRKKSKIKIKFAHLKS